MKVGIFVYSETGNTRQVAGRVEERVGSGGHEVVIHELKADKDRSSLSEVPPVAGYELLCIGSPVHAFSLSNPMTLFLQELPPLDGTTVAFFVTQALPFSWLGGNRAMRAVRRAVENKGGNPLAAGIVHWPSSGREQEIESVVANIESRLK